ncbi:aminoacetone oxidase family FAD-binding enzyme [Arabiibacter massiliensis]|uniref:aminoacetone oxidase family FAD-binding enzyme n=1 Tax=Arabiibacter massiliensis TaxID=1870985 RepID=UPI001E399053|nr:aminoacetone oxidase family FAD-binding enzyme [Arabiibacter massiliensis]
MEKLAIIGGGAAGLAAAIAAGRALREGGKAAEVVVYERDERVGRSILATGNGRCNFSNAQVDAGFYRNGTFVGASLLELAAQQGSGDDPVHAFFGDLGLAWREESEGRLYPLANKATSVLDVLRAAAAVAGVREACGRQAVRVDVPTEAGGRFHIRFVDGAVEHADAVIVAVGGRALAGIELPGALPASAPAPVLGPLRTDPRVTRQLNNIRVRCAVSLSAPDGVERAREQGELLFRDYGVSGIAVFNLSRFARPGDMLLVDLLPSVEVDEVESFLYSRRKRLAADGRALDGDAFLRGLVLPAVGRAVLREAGIPPEAPFGKGEVPALARALKGLALEVRGIGDERQCQVWRGGLDVGAFEPRACEAHEVPGLFAAGEALDVDAPCGGYNLHWAWASGILAGRAAVARLADGGAHA